MGEYWKFHEIQINTAFMDQTVYLCLIFVLAFVQHEIEGLNCRENPCLCCRSGNCTRPEQHVFPCRGCKDGYTNPSCYELCPVNCVNCSQLFYENDADRICYLCKNGFYNGQYKDIKSYPLQQDCSLACVDNCDICSSYYNCINCKESHYLVYGRDCIKCPLNCSQCLPDAGCVACIDGYVWTGRVCEPCKPNCKRCELSDECSECYSGFYLYGGICNKCPTGCLTCTGLRECNKCQEGYILTGSTCKVNCSNCNQEMACDKSSGYCSDGCLPEFSGSSSCTGQTPKVSNAATIWITVSVIGIVACVSGCLVFLLIIKRKSRHCFTLPFMKRLPGRTNTKTEDEECRCESEAANDSACSLHESARSYSPGPGLEFHDCAAVRLHDGLAEHCKKSLV